MPIKGDVVSEGNETVTVTLGTTPTNATVSTAGGAGGATGTITDDDDAPTGIALSVDPASIAESAAETEVTVTATVTGGTTFNAAKTVRVTVGGGAGTATSGEDHTAVSGFDITLDAGATSATATFDIDPLDDDVDEGSETIEVAGREAGGAAVSAASITLTDDDTRGVAVTGGPLSVEEADNPDTAGDEEHKATYTVALTSEPTDDVRIELTAPAMVTVGPARLDFTPSDWDEAQTVTVTAVDDDIDNADDERAGSIAHAVVAGESDYGGVAAASAASRRARRSLRAARRASRSTRTSRPPPP